MIVRMFECDSVCPVTNRLSRKLSYGSGPDATDPLALLLSFLLESLVIQEF
jgi:hypothetical protein